MFDEQLRVFKEAVLTRVARLGLLRVPPLALTLLGLLFGVLTAVALAGQQYAWGFLFWFLNRLFDGLDGTVARLTQQQSDLGGYLDILLDFVVYAIIPLGLAWGRPSSAVYPALAFLLATFYVNAASWMYLAAVLEKRRLGRTDKLTTTEMPDGLVGGGATILFYTLFILFPAYLSQLFAVMAALVVVTIAQRLVWAVRRLR